MSNNLIFSIVICTFNRCDLLSHCLETIEALDYPRHAFETLIIDNNSSDDTERIATEFSSRNSNARYVFEPAQGLSHARNRGAHEAAGQYVAYLDDECKIPSHWLTTAERVFRETKARIMGGPYDPWYEADKPAWYKDAYGAERTMKVNGWLPEDVYASGGNLFLERSLFHEVGGFRTDLGVIGTKQGAGEEVDLQRRARSTAGAEAFYCEDLLVTHCVREEKTRLLWHMRMMWQRGRHHALMSSRDRPICKALYAILSSMAQIGLGSIHALAFRDRVRQPYMQNYIYEIVGPRVHAVSNALASIVLKLKNSRSRRQDQNGNLSR